MQRILLVLLLAAAGSAFAAAPSSFVLPHEGRLLDGQDNPVNGTLAMTFGIFDDQHPDSSSELWSATVQVPVVNGVYSLALGDTTANQPAIPASIFAPGLPRWLSVSIGGTELLPRMQIGTAPHALAADNLGGRPASDYALRADLDAVSDLAMTGIARLQGNIDALSEWTVTGIAGARADAISESEAYALAQDQASAASLTAAIQSAQASAISAAESYAAAQASQAQANAESAAAAKYLPLAGGTLTGGLAVNGNLAVNGSFTGSASFSRPITASEIDGNVTFPGNLTFNGSTRFASAPTINGMDLFTAAMQGTYPAIFGYYYPSSGGLFCGYPGSLNTPEPPNPASYTDVSFGRLLFTDQGAFQASYGTAAFNPCNNACYGPVTFFLISPASKSITLTGYLDDGPSPIYLNGTLVATESSGFTQTVTVPAGSFSLSFIACSANGASIGFDISNHFITDNGLSIDYDRVFHRNGK